MYVGGGSVTAPKEQTDGQIARPKGTHLHSGEENHYSGLLMYGNLVGGK